MISRIDLRRDGTTPSRYHADDRPGENCGVVRALIHELPVQRFGILHAMGNIADISVARNALREKRKALFRTYLWAEFPARYVTGLTEKGAAIFASAEISAHVIDYFAAYGTTVSLEEAAEVLTGAWTYLSMHPGRYWAAYTINSPHTYRALTKDFLPDEHAYIAAIAAGDRPTAARVFPKTRWADELGRKMAVSRASLHKEPHR